MTLRASLGALKTLDRHRYGVTFVWCGLTRDVLAYLTLMMSVCGFVLTVNSYP